MVAATLSPIAHTLSGIGDGQHALTLGATICRRSAAQQGRGFRRDITFITTPAIWNKCATLAGETAFIAA